MVLLFSSPLFLALKLGPELEKPYMALTCFHEGGTLALCSAAPLLPPRSLNFLRSPRLIWSPPLELPVRKPVVLCPLNMRV